MKPAPFKYLAAETVDEAVEVLAEHGDEAKVLAGGQSLVPLMNLRLAVPGVLVDLNRLAELQGIRRTGARDRRDDAPDRGRALGDDAARRSSSRRFATSPSRRPQPGHDRRHGRARGSGRGAPAVLLALGGEVVARGPAASARSPPTSCSTYFTTALARRGTDARSHPAARAGGASQEVARKQGDFALAGAAVAVGDRRRHCGSARIVLFGVADRPVRATAAEQALAGRKLDRRAPRRRRARAGRDRAEVGLARVGRVPQGGGRRARAARAAQAVREEG